MTARLKSARGVAADMLCSSCVDTFLALAVAAFVYMSERNTVLPAPFRLAHARHMHSALRCSLELPRGTVAARAAEILADLGVTIDHVCFLARDSR